MPCVPTPSPRRSCTNWVDVVLGGGCFNRILTQRIVARLSSAGLNVLQADKLSCGDAGLALGQAWVAEWALGIMAGGKQHENGALAQVEYVLAAI